MMLVVAMRGLLGASGLTAILVCGAAVTAGLAQEVPAASQEAPTLRLPAGVRPTRQAVDLAIDPKLEAFYGTTVIDVAVDRAVPVVWLNARQLKVTRAVLDGAPGSEPLELVTGSDEAVGLRRRAGAFRTGVATLRLEYEGVISRRDTEGIFAQESGGDWYVFTQFEPLGARRAFPCFDEPGFKIPWQITLRVPEGVQAFSNGPERARERRDGRITVSFAETPPLPTYLVAAAVGPFDIVDGGRAGQKGTPLRIIVPRGRGAEAAHAVRMTPRILEWLEAYFGTPYPFDKLDQIAVPSFGGAMENAGLITYTETLLLQKPGQETLEGREWYLKLAAHEVAHNWFGNLVTMAWWDDLWLNEGFASWMHQRVAEELAPELNLSPGAVLERSMALDSDALASARKVRQPIASHHDIAGAFDGITYLKGQAVLQMVEGWLGRDLFRDGVRRYLAAHARGNATSADFVAALSATAGRDLSGIFSSFLEQTGAPVISAALACDGGTAQVQLQQRPYRPLGGGAVPATTWQVPVCLESRVGNDAERVCTVLTEKSAAVPLRATACSGAVLANQGYTGYYRALHAPDIHRRLMSDRAALSAAARQGLLLDIKALVQSGDATAAQALQAAASSAGDEDRYVGLAAISTVGWLRAFVPDTSRADYEAFARSLFAARARRLGWRSSASDAADVRGIRADVLRAAGLLGADPSLRHEAVALAKAWLKDETAIEPDIAGAALPVAVSAGDAGLTEALREFLIQTKDRTRRGQVVMALSFAGSRDSASLLLPLALDSRVEPMDALHLVISMSRSRATREDTLRFVMQHYDAFVARLPQGSTFDGAAGLLNVGGSLCTQRERDTFQQFFADRVQKIPGGPRQLTQVLEGIDACIAQRQAIEPGIAEFLATLPKGDTAGGR